MSNFKIHQKQARQANATNNLVPLKIFKAPTNVLSCYRCGFLALKRKDQPRHDCQFEDQVPGPVGENNQPDDVSSHHSSSDDHSPRKRRRHYIEPGSEIPAPEYFDPSFSVPKCSNFYYMRQNNLTLKIECHEQATSDHKTRCKARYGSTQETEDWCKQSNNKINFLHLMMDFLLSPTMRDSFSTVFNTKLSKLSSNEDWLVENPKSVRGVQITKANNSESYLISTNNSTRIISMERQHFIEIAGPFASRRQLENRLKILRRMNIQVPSNLRYSLAHSRDQVRRFSRIIEYDEYRSSIDPKWSACISFTAEGLENYLNELIMESTIFDYTRSMTVAIDAGKSYLKASLILNTPKHKMSHDYQGNILFYLTLI